MQLTWHFSSVQFCSQDATKLKRLKRLQFSLIISLALRFYEWLHVPRHSSRARIARRSSRWRRPGGDGCLLGCRQRSAGSLVRRVTGRLWKWTTTNAAASCVRAAVTFLINETILLYRSADVALWRSANHNNRSYLAAYNLELLDSWVLAMATNRRTNKGNIEGIAWLSNTVPTPLQFSPSRT